jgi:hypothetical protein
MILLISTTAMAQAQRLATGNDVFRYRSKAGPTSLARKMATNGEALTSPLFTPLSCFAKYH